MKILLNGMEIWINNNVYTQVRGWVNIDEDVLLNIFFNCNGEEKL